VARFRRLTGAALCTTLVAGMTVSLLVTTAEQSYAAPVPGVASAGRPWPGHPGRTIVMHRVRRGETATGLAVRFHAWTDELLAINHLHRRSVLYVGERIKIPVVLAAARRARQHTHHKPHHQKTHHHKAHQKPAPKAHHRSKHHQRSLHDRGWRHYRMSRAEVARRIATEARRQGVSPSLAQAIGWQESGWYQPVVSSAGAIGVMQLLPSTGRWMEGYVGRRLKLRDTWDNVKAGVVLIHVLQRNTRNTRRAIGAYYQGLGGVQRHGLYPETKRYVKNVRAIQKRLAEGRLP
jgi:LysM repeat protein